MQRRTNPGPERYILGIAMLIPLALIAVILLQVPGVSLAAPNSLIAGQNESVQLVKRPQPSNAAPPPTLAPPTATPRPTATPVPAPQQQQPAATATPAHGRTYVVQQGDELKHIAASYGVSIWTIIQTNNIPNPDSLRVGQELKIPDN
jgi:LysM repeat protein